METDAPSLVEVIDAVDKDNKANSFEIHTCDLGVVIIRDNKVVSAQYIAAPMARAYRQ